MIIVVTFVHIVACIILVLVVLLQAGKGADMGAVFGGASSTIFGSSGAGNFLTRLTAGAAIVFMITSLTLTYGSSRTGTATLMPESATAPGAEAPLGDLDAAAPADVVEGDVADAPAGDTAAPAEAPVDDGGEGTAPAAPPAEPVPAAP